MDVKSDLENWQRTRSERVLGVKVRYGFGGVMLHPRSYPWF
jgi:hypothetical protein